MQMTGWQPISTAPKDGTEVLVCGYRQQSVAAYREGYWRVYTDEGWFGSDQPATHWMPLPEPPEDVG